MEVNTKEDFQEIYKKDPGLALGIMFESHQNLAKQCACRLENCKKEIKRSRNKNIAIQTGSGILGGFLAWMTTRLGG